MFEIANQFVMVKIQLALIGNSRRESIIVFRRFLLDCTKNYKFSDWIYQCSIHTIVQKAYEEGGKLAKKRVRVLLFGNSFAAAITSGLTIV